MECQPDTTPTIAEQDVRLIVRLLGKVIAADGGIREKRRVLMDGLCEIIQATGWVWCLAETGPDPLSSVIGFEHGGRGEERSASWIEAIAHSRTADLTGLTATLRQVHPAMHLTETENGTHLVSQRSMEGGGFSGIVVYRELGGAHFDKREAKIARIVLSEVSWLHFAAFPEQDCQANLQLYPRHRTVLNLLSEGWSRKKIAENLGISENTVHGYAKAVFKHFGVHSQSELLARLSKGDGGEY